jgi:CRP-like cAMP-binding protein
MVADRTRNVLLQQLARADSGVFAEIFDTLEPVSLERSAVLGPARLQSEFVYFVEAGIVSLVASTRTGSSVEVALVGREGAAGVADALGQRPLPYQLIVQMPGLAYRAPKDVIRQHILSCTTLHGLLMDYSQHIVHQLAQSALCNRFHTSVQRLARWLLLTAERAETNRLELTHEFIAQMVGAPRSAVSEAAAALRTKRIIEYQRGVLTVRRPEKLQKIACECFEAVSLPAERATTSARPMRSTTPPRRSPNRALQARSKAKLAHRPE